MGLYDIGKSHNPGIQQEPASKAVLPSPNRAVHRRMEPGRTPVPLVHEVGREDHGWRTGQRRM